MDKTTELKTDFTLDRFRDSTTKGTFVFLVVLLLLTSFFSEDFEVSKVEFMKRDMELEHQASILMKNSGLDSSCSPRYSNVVADVDKQLCWRWLT